LTPGPICPPSRPPQNTRNGAPQTTKIARPATGPGGARRTKGPLSARKGHTRHELRANRGETRDLDSNPGPVGGRRSTVSAPRGSEHRDCHGGCARPPRWRRRAPDPAESPAAHRAKRTRAEPEPLTRTGSSGTAPCAMGTTNWRNSPYGARTKHRCFANPTSRDPETGPEQWIRLRPLSLSCRGGAEVVQRWCRGGAEVVQRWCRGGAEVVQLPCNYTFSKWKNGRKPYAFPPNS
jgi:hypothetical protein